ncbi:MAG: DUF4926 domain-containing protein [Anaerolineae bacterium]|nr:DUF4926 domain-containing protein [Anaerolineae bacterium]
MIQALERVALTIDLPDYHLKAGDMGTVVDITGDGHEVTVEFFTLDGETFAVIPVLASQICRTGSREIAHARLVES